MAPVSRQISSDRVPFEQFLPGLGGRSSITDTESQFSQSSRSDAAMLKNVHSLIEEGNQNPRSNTDTVPMETEFGKRLQKMVKLVMGFAFGLSVAIIIAVMTNMRKLARNHREHNLYEASAAIALICFLAAVGLLISVLAEWRGELAQRVQIVLMVIAVVSLIASVVAVAMNAVI